MEPVVAHRWKDDEIGGARFAGDMLGGRPEGQGRPPIEIGNLRQCGAKFRLRRRSALPEHVQVMLMGLEWARASAGEICGSLFGDDADDSRAETLGRSRYDAEEIRVRLVDAQAGEQGRESQICLRGTHPRERRGRAPRYLVGGLRCKAWNAAKICARDLGSCT